MKPIHIVVLASLLAFNSCSWHRVRGSGTVRTELRDVPAFEAITCDGSYDVQVGCRGTQSVAIEADDNLLPLIKTEVNNRSLRIFTKGDLVPSKEIRIRISVPNLSAFTVNGSSHGGIDSVNGGSFSVDVNGSAKLHVSGKASDTKIDISGSSKIDAASLAAEDASVGINGSGEVHVCAANSIDVQINGSGKVRYTGEPKHVHEHINGSGSVQKE